MYLPSLINRYRLFTGLGGWPRRATGEEPLLLDHVLFRATAVASDLAAIREGEARCRSEFAQIREQLELRRDRLIYWSPSLIRVLTAFSSCLLSIRAAQDLLPRLVGQTLGVGQVPLSMRDARLGRSELPVEITDRVRSYWEDHGQRLKDYRDLDLHHWSVAEHCFLHLTDPPRVLLVLPDNPADVSRADLTYAEDIDGIQYLQRSVQELDALILDLCTTLGGEPAPLKVSVRMEHFGKLETDVSQTVAVLYDNPEAGSGVVVGQNPARQVVARQFFVTDDD